MFPLYIHNSSCISPQRTFGEIDIQTLRQPVDNKLEVIEPYYKDIPSGALRRMGKAVRIGVGAALPLLHDKNVNGIIIGTANGGMEDCIRFLNQIIDYDEGRLTPANFVQSTANAIAAQLGMMHSNKGYNITHVQGGLSFENALLDAAMMVSENKDNTYLAGAVDEISSYNYNIDWLAGWYKKEIMEPVDFYKAETTGSIAGEGAAMFIVNGIETNAIAEVEAVHIFHTEDEELVQSQLQRFVAKHIAAGDAIDLFLTGENGDSRYTKYYDVAGVVMPPGTTVARYKHFCGEYPTSSAVALWIACHLMQEDATLPKHMIKKEAANMGFKRTLIYNHYKARQHSLIMVRSKP